ncbi:hypothetical protein EMIT0158MI4_80094 [Burkholderia ambifaria]
MCASRAAGAGIRAARFRPNAGRGAHRAHGNLGEAMFWVAKHVDPVSRFALYRHALVLTFLIDPLDTFLKTGHPKVASDRCAAVRWRMKRKSVQSARKSSC